MLCYFHSESRQSYAILPLGFNLSLILTQYKCWEPVNTLGYFHFEISYSHEIFIYVLKIIFLTQK